MKTFQAQPGRCLVLQVTVKRGRNITLGRWSDMLDTPDPYVQLFIPTTPNGRKKTKVIQNEKNPEWNETFQFFLDPRETNTLHVTLKESDLITADDYVGETQLFELNDLQLDNTVPHSFVFGEASYVDMEISITEDSGDETDLRYSVELCEEETIYLKERRKVVFEAMTSLLGDRAPRNPDEVPTVAVLGSGGGFRAMTALSGACTALADMKILDCATYMAGLSGSAWYLSTLYSHPKWPHIHPREVMAEIRENVATNWMKLLITPTWMYRRIRRLKEKSRCGQPVSFTDFFGYLVGDTLLKQRTTEPRLSDQRTVIEKGQAPLPIYTCLHVKENETTEQFSEWVEFTPHEIGMARYGTFLQSHLFGNKFFLGKLLTNYPEPVLHFEQGIWGSAFTVLLQKMLRDNQHPNEVAKNHGIKGDGRKELEEMVRFGDEVDTAWKDEESDEEDESGNDSDTEEVDSKVAITSAQSPAEPGKETKEAASNNNDQVGFWDRFASSAIEKFNFLRTREGRAGLVHNFLRGLQLQLIPEDYCDSAVTDLDATKRKRMFVVDSGLLFNSPYPPLLRPQRGVDLYISFDFSVRKKDLTENPLKELELAERWAQANQLPFPPINADETFARDGMKECYVFRHPTDVSCPVIIHFVLVNDKFRDFKMPGVPRSEEEKEEADFSLFEDPKDHYSTFEFHYANEPFDRLTKLMEFNTLLCGDVIKDVMAECVLKRRNGTVVTSHSLVELEMMTNSSSKRDECSTPTCADVNKNAESSIDGSQTESNCCVLL